MWTVLAVIMVVVALFALAWRLRVVARRAPDENDRSRQHEVPGGADQPPPPAPPR